MKSIKNKIVSSPFGVYYFDKRADSYYFNRVCSPEFSVLFDIWIKVRNETYKK